MIEYGGNPVFEGEILLCEDNSMNQELISARLAKMGLKITTAENGEEGIEKVKYRIQNGTKPFDLIFMDIYMPVMGGIEAASEIVKLNTGSLIVAMTAGSTPAEKKHYTACGMTDCLNKPFTPEELMDCLSKYLTPVNKHTESYLIRQEEEKLEKKLIHTFVRNNKNLYYEITKAIDDEDSTLAHRLTHTLKGNAGFLGKTALQKAAKDAEDILRKGDRPSQSVMNVLKTELDAVLKEFAPLDRDVLPGENLTVETKTNEQTQALFKELEDLLDGGDVQCLNLTGQLLSIPGTGELIQQIEYFEFDKAKETLAWFKNGGYHAG